MTADSISDLMRADGQAVQSLGMGGTSETRPQWVDRAYRHGIDYFFFYSQSFTGMVDGLTALCRKHRNGIIVATGEEARDADTLIRTRDRAFDSLGTEYLDIFYVEYVSPHQDSWAAVAAALAEVARWKAEGIIRYVGASAHDRKLAGDLAETGMVDVLMQRYNMAHRKSETSALPRAEAAGVPVVAFTCTRWGSLLRGHPEWVGKVPTATECYRFALSHTAVRMALTAPGSLAELDENAKFLQQRSMSEAERDEWSQYGDLIYGDGVDAFETRWP